MTNIEKMCEIFPHIKTSCVKAMKICPAVMYGYVVCPFREKITDENIEKLDLKNVYDPTNKKCILCSRMFWKSEYDGAERIEYQEINTLSIREGDNL